MIREDSIEIHFTPEQHRNLLDALAIADKVQQWSSNTMDAEYDGKYIKLAVDIDFTLDGN